MPAAKTPTFAVRHLHFARALFAAMAAVMITFSSRHDAEVGLSVFSGFAVATAIAWALSAWLIYPAGRRWAPVLLAIVNGAAGIVAGMPPFRTTTLFFVVVIVWAIVTAVIEGGWGLRERKGKHRVEAKEALSIAVITLVLAIATLVIQPTYALEFYNKVLHEGGTLTGITIAVGVFGGYAAILAVYLAIAGFSPRNEVVARDIESATQEVTS